MKKLFRMKKPFAVLICFLLVSAIVIQLFSNRSVKGAESELNYVDAFAKSIMYYEASWCGEDAGENRLDWRGPCHVEDGKDVGLDLTGGFHDAGDHVKFGQPQEYAASTLGWAYYEFKDTFKKNGQDKYMLNILKHFTDYFLKCYPDKTTFYYQVGDGAEDHAYWGPPELQSYTRPTLFKATPETPASDMCGGTAAALALMYLNYKDIDETYAEKCLTAAKDLYDFGKTYKGLGDSGGFYGSTNYWDELCWGAVWLNIATGDSAYLTDVDSYMEAKNITSHNTYQNHWTLCWDDVYAGVFMKLSQITDNELYKKVADENLEYFINGGGFRTPGGVTYINSWGALRYTAAEAMLSMVKYKYSKEEKYLDYAKDQMDYILGDNPRNSSYVVGFGNNYPKFPHHRAASGRYEWQPACEKKSQTERHLLYGALVGGPDSQDQYKDDVEEYAYTEVAIDYNAGFVGAMAAMAEYFGEGQKAEDTPGIEDLDELAYYANARVMEENAQHVTIDVFLHNESNLPPKFGKNLSFRYFVNLSEYYNVGLTVKDVNAQLNYGAYGGKLSELLPWNEAAHIYYVEGSWPNTEIYGNVESQFAIANYNFDVWDSSNDFSFQGLNSTSKTVTSKIPIYDDGVKLYGEEPSKTEVPTPTPTPSSASESSLSSTPTAVTGNYEIEYLTEVDWGEGATIEATLTNNTSKAANGWALNFDFAGDQKIDSVWSGTFTQSGKSVTIKNSSSNTTIPKGGSVNFGFNMVYSGTNSVPDKFTVNGIECIVKE